MVALCKCGYRPGNAPNPWYTIIYDSDTSEGRSMIAQFTREEKEFHVVKHFESEDEARSCARENGMRFPHGN